MNTRYNAKEMIKLIYMYLYLILNTREIQISTENLKKKWKMSSILIHVRVHFVFPVYFIVE